VGVAVGVALGVLVGVAVAVAVAIAVGVGVDVGVGVGPPCAQYLPPVLNWIEPLPPPQTIISLPVHTAVSSARPSGVLIVLVAVQLSVEGLYRPPVIRKLPLASSPPYTIISRKVQTAV